VARKSSIECPKCLSAGRIATSKRVTVGLRELYCQCLNLNCSEVFVMHQSFSHYVKRTGENPDPALQPELCRDDGQIDMFEQ
jgi:hypothetical protein